MEQRRLGGSGLFVPALTLGTATFGGGNAFFRAWGDTGPAGARELVSHCLAVGVTMFDTADSYSGGLAEEVLGEALTGRRDEALLASKASEPVGPGPNDGGSSRWHLVRSVEASLRRLRTDHLDLYYLHLQDRATPLEETLSALEVLVSSGKVRYVAASNLSASHLLRSLTVADRHGWPRHVAHQVHYSLLERSVEWEVLPLGVTEQVGTVAYSPLGGGTLTGKWDIGAGPPAGTRLAQQPLAAHAAARVDRIAGALGEVATRTGRTHSQVALAWVLGRPGVASAVFGARTPEQLADNVGAVGWALDEPDRSALEDASAVPLPYPYSQQAHFAAVEAARRD